MNISLNRNWLAKATLYIGVSATIIIGEANPSNATAADDAENKNLSTNISTNISTNVSTNLSTNEALILDMRQNLASEDSVASQEDATTSAYQQLIADLEDLQGAYDPALSEQLFALGAALQSQARHEEAVDVFKRGVHIARVNTGLYSAEQLTMLRAEINSHLMLGNFVQADERQRYLYRVERRALRANSTASAQALLDQARWQRQAYVLGIGENDARFGRLQAMWQLNRMALEEVINTEGDTSPALLTPLYGMLQSQYLMAGYQGFDEVLAGLGTDDRQLANNGLAYKQGVSVLEAIMQINIANNPNDMRQRARDLTQLSDWSWWFGARNKALENYRAAYDVIAKSDDPEALFEELFAAPTPLPDIDGIEPLPAYNTNETNDEGVLAIRFGVTDTGQVTDITQLRAPENEPEDAFISNDRFLRHLRRVRFRPTFQEGELKSRTDIVWSFNPQTWQTNPLVMTQ